MDKALLRRSRLCWGLCVICALFLLETWNADRLMPHPASPWIWSLLGIAAALSAGLATWFAFRSRRSGSGS